MSEQNLKVSWECVKIEGLKITLKRSTEALEAKNSDLLKPKKNKKKRKKQLNVVE